MSMRTDRRRFLQASAAGGALLGLGDLGFLSRLRPVSADEATLDPKVVRLQPEIEPLVRLLEETPRERLLEEVAARIQKGTELSRRARGAPAGRRAQRAAAAQRRPQVPRGPGGQLGPPGQPRARPTPTAGCRSSGRSTTSRARRPRTSARATGRWARWTSRPSRPPARPARRSSRRWTAGTRRPPTRRSPAWPARPAPTRSTSCSSATAPATSARSATRRSTWPTAGGRSSASAGSTPSRSCGRWPTPCCMHEDGNPARARRPGRPPLDGTTRSARPGSRRAGRRASPTRRPRPTCSPRLRKGSDDDACEQVVELLEPRRRAAVDLGRPVRRRRRAAAPPAGDRLAARGDLDQRPALRLPGQRRRPDPPAADAPERRVPHPVPRGDGRPRQGGRRADRSARAGRDVGGRPGGHRGDLRRGQPRQDDRRPQGAGLPAGRARPASR